ncbi:MAG TPA: hypothetical protein VFT16_03735 [Candidatus Saccharimonadales bacterium]|nr:hypothetical protein [Candidatus Saccharimonadales bacterium]
MYSGTTLTPLSGRMLGAHQKLDRLARGSLRSLLNTDDGRFPEAKAILHFEGVNGPDAIKRKSPAKDEPWHYYSPFDDADTQIIEIIGQHYDHLVKALKAQDDVRASFEAAWLAHAIVDGLTPAHHFPYEETLTELRGGAGIETRTTVKEKIILPGDTRRQQVKNNWKMWGPRGLLATHGFFEFGVAALIAPFSRKQVPIAEKDMHDLYKYGVLELFRRKAKEIDGLDMYGRYTNYGWTPRLARQVRNHLAPAIVKMVTLAWYAAAIDAGIIQKKST